MLTHKFIFSCDDHSHDEDDPLTLEVNSGTKSFAIEQAERAGWSTHRDGRTFCGRCNERLKRSTK